MSPELVEKPKEDWSVVLKCPRCEYTYKYHESEFLKDTFKVSGYDFDGTAKWVMKPFVYCGNCSRELTFLPSDIPARVFEKAPREKGFGK